MISDRIKYIGGTTTFPLIHFLPQQKSSFSSSSSSTFFSPPLLHSQPNSLQPQFLFLLFFIFSSFQTCFIFIANFICLFAKVCFLLLFFISLSLFLLWCIIKKILLCFWIKIAIFHMIIGFYFSMFRQNYLHVLDFHLGW